MFYLTFFTFWAGQIMASQIVLSLLFVLLFKFVNVLQSGRFLNKSKRYDINRALVMFCIGVCG